MSSASQSRSGPLVRWARVAAHHPWRVIGGWVVALVVLVALSQAIGGTFVDSFSVPGAESQKALDALNSRFPSAAGDSAQVVFKADTNITTDPAVQKQINGFIAAAEKLPEVVSVSNPLAANSGNVSPNGQIAYLSVQYDKGSQDIETSAVDQLEDLVKATNGNGLETEVGGGMIGGTPGAASSELIGILAAVVVLLFMFGSLIAMGLPIITAGSGVVISTLIVTIVANFIDMPSISTALLSMMGLGVGIDYSLLLITRFREERSNGRRSEDSIVTAVDTAGRSVLFAGTVVVIALLGLWVTGVPFIGFLGLGGAV
ncbi:MAG TPA: MMPL family transporter, partial [Thermomicrobiales bacterium]|nr:MMPL family transporter [Thermomicrobiales bacterium]